MKKIPIKNDELKLFYSKNKDFLLPIGMIAVSITLLILVIFPQFQAYLALREETKAEMAKLQILRNNLSTLSSLDDSTLEGYLKISKLAVPPNKDFGSILNGVAAAANKANVLLGDFEFKVGDVVMGKQKKITEFPNLQLTVTINSDFDSFTAFLEEVEKTLPLAEVLAIKRRSDLSAVTLIFYYKPFLPINLRDEAPIKSLSSNDSNILNSFSSWNNSTPQVLPEGVIQSSQSGSVNGPF